LNNEENKETKLKNHLCSFVFFVVEFVSDPSELKLGPLVFLI